MKRIHLAIIIILVVLIAVFIARNTGIGNATTTNIQVSDKPTINNAQPSSSPNITPSSTDNKDNDDDEISSPQTTSSSINSSTQSNTQSNLSTQNEPTATSASGITITELATHNSRSDCWIVYQKKVYDITSFLPRHPGGINAIARHCGTQGFENAFVQQHGTSKVSMMMKVTTFIGDFDVVGTMQ